ncbi:MAG: universal stress protein [Symploca sp. SIO2B6]|nr:universal stress protein [Symploca sp. SIO2B6]
MINRILLAVAGRGLCEQMFNMLMEIPYLQGASVTVLHVVTPQITSEEMSTKLEEGGKILADAVKSLNVDAKKITPRLKQGEPKDVVLQIAEEEKSDLIIMGSRGLKRIESILQNSVSQYVFQLTDKPMLLVKDGIYLKQIRRLMVPVDKSEAAKQSVNLALSLLQDIKGGQLFLVHVNPDPESTSSDPEKDPVLAPAVAAAKKKGVAYRCLVSEGNAGAEICCLAEENNIDLLMLGSPDRRPSIAKSLPDLDRLLGSSLSDYIRVNANCPVLLTRVAS